MSDGPDRLPSASPAPLQDTPSPTGAARYIFCELLFPEKAVPCWNAGSHASGGGSLVPQATTSKLVSNLPPQDSPRKEINSRTFLLVTADPARARCPILPARWQRQGQVST